ncbi:MAG: hypothetical protein WCR55_09150 [Lentisphaerota bacterium]
MSRSNFVGTKLINLKDKLSSVPKVKDEVEKNTLPSLESNTIIEDKVSTQEVLFSQNVLESESVSIPDIPIESVPQIEHLLVKEEKKEKIDKHLLKALKERKTDYLRTKDVVIKYVTETISEVSKVSNELEKRRDIYLNSLDKLQSAINEINAIDELKWDEYDFSIDLADASKLVEHARIESIICKDKFKMPEKALNELVTQTPISVTDIFSSTLSQLFKFGFKVFLPLIIGIVLAAIIISLTILVSMGSL